MKNKISMSGGYVGLVALLVSVAIVALVVWKLGPFTAKNEGEGSKIEQDDLQALEQAKLLKDVLEQRDRQMR